MSYPVQVVFLGLIAFVPYNVSGPPYMALLPQTVGGQYASDGCHLPEHTPRMIIKAQDCINNRGDRCSQMKNATPGPLLEGDGGNLFYLDLKGLDLALTLDGAGVTPHARNGTGSVPENQDDAEDLHWLPTLQNKNKVDGDCVDWLGGNKTCPVAARVLIENAYLETCHLVEAKPAEGKDPELCSYRFKSYHETLSIGGEAVQAIADGATTQYVSSTPYLVLSLGTLWTHTTSDLTTLIVTPDPLHGVTIWIIDIPLGALDNDKRCLTSAARARDYEIYYNLLDRRNGPVPLDERPSPTETAYCRPDAPGHRRQPSQECPALPAPYAKDLAHHFYPNDLTACGHMMLTP